VNSRINLTTDLQGRSAVVRELEGRTLRVERVQVLHIDLLYTDGSIGQMNLTAPLVQRGEDIERQAIALRDYLKGSAELLGVARHHFHAYTADPDGSLRKAWLWYPYDHLTGEEIRPNAKPSGK
jgi:hypothetical protein